jgi:OmpA-OmpF porin, OOP family
MKTFRPKLLALAIGAVVASSLHAGTIRLYAPGKVPHPCVVARILSHANPESCAHTATRGLSINPHSHNEETPITDSGRDLHEEQLSTSASAAVAAWESKLAHQSEPPAQPTQITPIERNQYTPPIAEEAPSAPAEQVPAQAEDAAPEAVAHAPVAAAPEQVAPALEQQAPPTALAVVVNFANNSARLQADAAATLEAVAQGIKLSGYERKIVIEGHTNSTGKPAHNTRLSQRRAEAVKAYLVQTHGIPERVLVAVGFGSKAPLAGYNAHAAENRRVQFKALET